MKKLTVISLGWGVQSWTLAAMVALGELPEVDFAIHSDTTWEYKNTYQFSDQWTPWLAKHGVKVITVNDEKAAKQIIDNTGRTFAPLYTLNNNSSGQLRRSCTHRWKIGPMRRYIRRELKQRGITKEAGVVEQWIGITTDEWQRAKDSDVNYISHRFPLLDKKMSRQDCLDWLKAKKIPTPGKSSCTFCPYHSREMWLELKRNNGADWQQAKTVDEAIRHLRPGYQSFVHQDRIPIEKLVLPETFGTQLQLLQFDDVDAECDSGFCFL